MCLSNIVEHCVFRRNQRKKRLLCFAAFSTMVNMRSSYLTERMAIHDKRTSRQYVLLKILNMAEDNAALFKRMYRLDQRDFFALYEKIKAKISKKCRSGRSKARLGDYNFFLCF